MRIYYRKNTAQYHFSSSETHLTNQTLPKMKKNTIHNLTKMELDIIMSALLKYKLIVSGSIGGKALGKEIAELELKILNQTQEPVLQ